MKSCAKKFLIPVLLISVLICMCGCHQIESSTEDIIDEPVVEPASITLGTVFNGGTVDICDAQLRTFLQEDDTSVQHSFLLEHEGEIYDYQSLIFSWNANQDSSFEVSFSTREDFSDSIKTVTYTTRLQASVFMPDTLYFWQVKGLDSGVCSEIDSFYVGETPVRIISIDGLKNVRDMGGWSTEGGKKVRYGMLYRGSQMNGYDNGPLLTESGRIWMKEVLGIRSEIDLRTQGADDANQISNMIDTTYPYLKAPFFGYTHIFPQNKLQNRRFDSRVPGSFKSIFEFLSNEENYPVYLHCNAGADRTGTIAFLINGLLGVNYFDLTKDFEITSFTVFGNRWCADLTEECFVFEDGVMQDDANNYIAWDRMYNYMMLNYITDSGRLSDAIENYLISVCDISVETLDKIKSIMLA